MGSLLCLADGIYSANAVIVRNDNNIPNNNVYSTPIRENYNCMHWCMLLDVMVLSLFASSQLISSGNPSCTHRRNLAFAASLAASDLVYSGIRFYQAGKALDILAKQAVA